VLLLSAVAGPATADWPSDPTVNVPLSTAVGSQRSPTIVPDGAGGAIVAWVDSLNGNLDIYAQRVNAAGVPQWTAGGVAVCAAASNQQSPTIVSDGAGGAIVTWGDFRSGTNNDIYAQRVSAAGAPQWTADGVAVCTAVHNQFSPTIASDGAGGAIVTWYDARSGLNNDIYAQRVNAAGTPQWTADGVGLCVDAFNQGSPTIVSDGAGGAIVAWEDARNGSANVDIYAQRVNAAGTPQWTANGVALSTAANNQRPPAIASDGAGGAIVTWYDTRTSPSPDIYAQRVNAAGTPQWTADGVALCTDVSSQQFPTIVSDGAGGAIVTWRDFRGPAYAQRVNAAGTPQWTADGVALSSVVSSQQFPTIVPDGAGGAIVTWYDSRSGTADVYAQRVNAAGTSQWAAGGVAVSTAANDQQTPTIASDGAGGAIVTWEDLRSGTNFDIYAQRVTSSGSLGGPAPADCPIDPTVNVPLCTAANNQNNPTIVSDGTGGAIVTWDDYRSGSADIYAQRVNAAGTPQWTADGVALCTAAGDQEQPTVVPDGAGGAIVTWEDRRSGTDYDIYAQRVNAAGAPQWTANGVALCTAASEQLYPTIVSDGAGGAIVTWEDLRSSPGDIYAQRVNAAGVPQWTADGVALSTAANGQQYPTIASDGAGGAIATWYDGRGGTYNDIYAQRVNAAGAPQWTADGVALCTAANDQYYPTIVSDGAGGAIVTWDDARSGSRDVYTQRVNGAGAPQWTVDGVALCTAANTQAIPTIVSDGAGGAIVTWSDYRSGTNFDIYAQRVNAAGTSQWTADGVALSTAANSQVYPKLASDGAGGAIVTWYDYRSGTNYDIYAQRVNAAGTPQWTANGVALSTAANDQYVPTIVSDGAGGAIVAWYDGRSGTNNHDIYAQWIPGVMGAPQANAVQPVSGGNTAPVTVSVLGQSLANGATVKLTRSGQPDIPGTNVTAAAGCLGLSATFDLAGKAVGAWNVVVTNPDLQTATLTNGFTIEALSAPQLRVTIVGPDTIRAGHPTPFDLVIENQGNVDASFVPLWITEVPTDATLSLDFALTAPPQDAGEPDWSTVPLTFTSAGGRYAPLVIPRVPPGTLTRRVYLTVPSSDPQFQLGAAVAPPWTADTTFRTCLSGGGVIANPSCMGTQLTAINAYLAANPQIAALSGIGLWAKVAWQCEGATTLPNALVKSEQVLDYLDQAVETETAAAGCGDVLLPRWRDRLAVHVVFSIDPNDKLGPTGTVSSLQAIPYSIRFENLSSATAAVRTLTVTDALATSLDLTTVSLGEIDLFGTVHLIPGAGSQQYTQDLDLGHDNLLVRTYAHLDVPSRQLSWSFITLDRTTLQPPSNPLLGFLPPNNPPNHAGEGSVLFTVQPSSGASDGTPIQNSAAITFDGTTQTTLAVVNTLDKQAPASNVVALISPIGSPSFTVSWVAPSPPPDLKDFTIYVAEDAGVYQTWKQNTVSTSDTYVPRPGGHTYKFYSVARDTSGNVEAAPVTPPDAQTYSTVAVEEGRSWQLALEGARPNPARGMIQAWFSLPNNERATLELIDIAGRRVARREVGSLGPGRHVVQLGASPRLRSGLYFLRLIQGERVLHARVVLMR
jgi:hypothetical protein